MSALAYQYDQVITLCFSEVDNITRQLLKNHQSILKEYDKEPVFIIVDLTRFTIEDVFETYPNADVDLTSTNLSNTISLFSKIEGNHNIFFYKQSENRFVSILGDISHLHIENLHVRHSIESCGASVKKDSLHFTPKDFHNKNDRETIKQIYKAFEPYIEQSAFGLIEAFPYALSKSKNDILSFNTKDCRVDKDAIIIFEQLEQLGILSILNRQSLQVKMNTRYSHIFKVMGQILEMYLYIVCLESKQFDDVKMSVSIDYNGRYRQGIYDASSEIDLICIRNNQPFYLSCKLSKIHQEDIYEIYTNAHHFGGDYAVSVLAISKQRNKITEYLINKAKELNVLILNKEHLSMLDKSLLPFFIFVKDKKKDD